MTFTLNLPDGSSGQGTDPIMANVMWARYLGVTLLFGMGKPTYPLPKEVIDTIMSYWTQMREQASDYGDPRGESIAREKIATALTTFYDVTDNAITEDDIIITVGGAQAIYCSLFVLTQLQPENKIIVPCPYYSLYEGLEGRYKDKFELIQVLNLPKYQLTAASIEKAIDRVRKNGKQVSAILTSDPNNPLGTIISTEEAHKIIQLLQREENRDIRLIIDGAYEEMRFDDKQSPQPLFALAPPEIRDRFILLRSATKALSLSGERVGIAVIRDREFRELFLKVHINTVGHAPKSTQEAFARGLEGLNDPQEARSLIESYQRQVEFVFDQAEKLGLNLPDEDYSPQATFYVTIDLSCLIGYPMSPKTRSAIQQANGEAKPFIEDDRDIVYHLLFEHGLLLAQYSAYGVSPRKGLVRITCSDESTDMEQLRELMTRLEQITIKAREFKQGRLVKTLEDLSSQYDAKCDTNETYAKVQGIRAEIDRITSSQDPSLTQAQQLRKTNRELERLMLDTKRILHKTSFQAAIIIQSLWRGHKVRKKNNEKIQAFDEEIQEKSGYDKWAKIRHSPCR